MVSFKVDADVLAKIQGTEDQEKRPIVAKVKGTGKDGGLGIQVSGDGSAPISAKISGDEKSPIALGQISVAPLSVSVPDIKSLAETLDLNGLVASIAKLTEGIKVGVSNDTSKPIGIAIGKIPVDLTISVFSPAEEPVFRVEIKGSVGKE
jgi:hypothetical protein